MKLPQAHIEPPVSAPNLPRHVAFLIEAVRSAPSADNSQPWCLQWDGRTLQARVVRRGGFPADYHATTFALGAASENLLCALRALCIDASAWDFGAPDASGIFLRGPVNEDASAATASALTASARSQHPPVWMRRHTNRYPYRKESADTFEAALPDMRAGDARIVVMRGDSIARAARWVRDASTVRFQTREVNEWFARSLRFEGHTRDCRDGLHVGTLALPPGGGTILRWLSDWRRLERANRFGIHRIFATIEASNFRRTPTVIAVLGPRTRTGAFDAGRCLQKAWLAATEAGRCGHPYYVVSDLLHRLDAGRVPTECVSLARSVAERVDAEFGGDYRLHCLMRVGVPVRAAPRSGRLLPDELRCKPEDVEKRDARAD